MVLSIIIIKGSGGVRGESWRRITSRRSALAYTRTDGGIVFTAGNACSPCVGAPTSVMARTFTDNVGFHGNRTGRTM